MKSETISICDTCTPQTPVIYTMCFRGAEVWCPRCNAKMGALDGGTLKVPLTDALSKLSKDLKYCSEDYRSAVGMVYSGGRTRFGGVMISLKDISEDKANEVRAIARMGFNIEDAA